MKEIVLGTAAMGGAAILHLQEEDNRLALVKGDWLDEAFNKAAKFMTGKNGFSSAEGRQMECVALAEILRTRDRFDPAKATPGGHPAYLNTIISHALKGAAQRVADERRVWSQMLSLDAPLGEDGGTHLDYVPGDVPSAEVMAEMGIGEGEDEPLDAPRGRRDSAGSGEQRRAIYTYILRMDVALVVAGLDARAKAWCQNVLAGYSPRAACQMAGISNSSYHSCLRPKLRKAFQHLRYAV